MVRRDDDDGSQDPELSRCASPAGASPASVSVGAPSSGSPEPREIVEAEARRQEPVNNGRQGRGPQQEVKLEILVAEYTLDGACDVKRGSPDALVLVEHLSLCPTSLWASPTGHLWAATTSIVRDLTNQTSWTLLASPVPPTGMISGRDDTHV